MKKSTFDLENSGTLGDMSEQETPAAVAEPADRDKGESERWRGR